jgi:plastocyanin
MRKILGLVLLAALPLSLTPTAMASSPQIVRAKVKIVNFAFNPGTLNISKGTRVIWKNTSTTTHTSTSDTPGLWDSGPIAPGTNFKRVFKKVGTFTYHCSIHPSMMAAVVVSA